MEIKAAKINGLNTYFVNYPGAKSASVQFWFRAGSSLESGKDLGIAHFLEHMFFKGTKKRPGSKIAHEVESFGGEINAFTSFDYTCYYINSPKKNLLKSVEILADMVSNPLFQESELIPERGVVFEEYRRSIDNPHHFQFHTIQKNSFSSGYNHPILGKPNTIKSFQRKQLVDFRKKYYNVKNSALIITADISNETKLKEVLKKYRLPQGPKVSFKKFKIKNSTNNIHTHKKDTSQATLTITIQAPNFEDKKAASEDLAVNCLAYGETSYLRQKLVMESSFATAASGSTMFMNEGGVHFLRLTYPVENHSKVLESFHETIKGLSRTLFSEGDVEKIKNQYLASKIYEKESLESFAFSLGHGFAQNEDLKSDEEFIERIKSVTTEEVNQSFLEILKKKAIHFHLQLPLDQEEKKYLPDLKKLSTNFSKILSTKEKNKSNSKKFPFDKSLELINIKPGIQLLYRKNEGAPTSVLHAYIKGGLSDENDSNNGSYYHLAKTITSGNEVSDYDELKKRLDFLSASMSGFSGKNAYGLTLHCLSQNIDKLSNDFFDTLLRPTFEEKYVEHEKTITHRLLEQIKVDPVKQCFKAFQKNLFGSHPYHRDIMGTPGSITGIKTEKLLELHKKNLSEKEILLTYCGNKDLSFILSKIETQFQNLEARKTVPFKMTPFKFSEKGKIEIDFDREQTQIFIGYPGLAMSQKEDKYLRILTNFLAGQSSELFVEVRDRQGLCYATQPVDHSALEGGYWGIYIGAGADKVDLAIDAIRGILDRISKNGLSSNEIKRVQRMILGQKAMQLQSNEDFANYYSIPTLHGLGPGFEEELLKETLSVSADGMKRFLKKFFKEEPAIVTAGPSLSA